MNAGNRPSRIETVGEDAEFRQKLYRRLAKTGMTQAELARKSGLTRDNISKYLRGVVKRPNDAALEKLAAALECEPSDLYSPRALSALPTRYVTADKDPVGKAYAQLQRYLSLEACLKIGEIIRADRGAALDHDDSSD